MPFEDRVFIEGAENLKTPIRVGLMKLTGETVMNSGPFAASGGRLEIRTTGLVAGAFVLWITDRDGRSARMLVVKR